MAGPRLIPRPFVGFDPRPRALLVDVGFTLTSYDGARVAEIAAERGVLVGAAEIENTELPLRAELAQHSWPLLPGSTAPPTGGARFFRRMLELSGARGAAPDLDTASDLVWRRHLEKNLWFRILPGVPEALGRLRDAGIRLAVVSNSEGTVEAMLEDVGLRPFFDVVIDSWVVGVSKPDPRIFGRALGLIGVTAADAVMVGDSPSADVAGAAAAGIRGALLDPFDLHREETAPRFSDFAAFADAVLQS